MSGVITALSGNLFDLVIAGPQMNTFR